MAQLSDSIERFIKELMCEEAQIEVKRNELAQHFGCAPSQINYVLATRFNVDRGYVIESRRGGGGFVRIIRLHACNEENLLDALLDRIGTAVTEETAVDIIEHIMDLKIITQSEALLMRAAVAKNALALPVNAKEVLRAAVMKSMLMQAFRNYERGMQR